MSSIQATAAQFTRMRETVNNIDSASEAQLQLSMANRAFHEMYENWLTLIPDAQEMVRDNYMDAQKDFHAVARILLEK